LRRIVRAFENSIALLRIVSQLFPNNVRYFENSTAFYENTRE
jgi:hypothetical protein